MTPAEAGEDPGSALPAPRVVAATVMVVLGFGTLMGSATGSAGEAAVDPVRVVLPAPAAAMPVAAAPPAGVPPPADLPAEEAVPEPEPGGEASASSTEPEPPSTPEPEATPEPKGTAAPEAELPAFGRVWVMWLPGRPFDASFASGTYLGDELRAKGLLLEQYHAIGHGSLVNGIALLSGQAPNPDTSAGCPERVPFEGTRPRRSDGQAIGRGCVFPKAVPTLLAGTAWRSYVQDLPAPCDTGGRNPAAYFAAHVYACRDEIAGLDRLDADLADAEDAPRFSLVAPAEGDPDGFVREWAPKILASPAFGGDGLLVVAFDHGPATGPEADFAACCDQPRGPNEPQPVDPQAPPEGGGRVGALLVSPLVKAGATVDTPLNHYGLARILADVLGTEPPGYAARGRRTEIFGG